MKAGAIARLRRILLRSREGLSTRCAQSIAQLIQLHADARQLYIRSDECGAAINPQHLSGREGLTHQKEIGFGDLVDLADLAGQ
jgi:hypothetical protein